MCHMDISNIRKLQTIYDKTLPWTLLLNYRSQRILVQE